LFAEPEPYIHAAAIFLSLVQGQQRMIPLKSVEQLASGIELLKVRETYNDAS
jgi:hypothetical protein